MRSVLLSILAVLLLVPTWSGDPRVPLYEGAPHVTATPVALDPADPTARTLGPLTYLGGVRLSSPDPAFGGFSSMLVDGDRFTLLSDFGLLFSFRMAADWRLREPRFGALPTGPGSGWTRLDRDVESMTRDPRTGRVWAGFERANAIWRYAPGFTHAEASAAPRAMRRWPDNGGPEAMARLRSGRFLVFSEERQVKGRPGTRVVLLFDRDPTRPGARSVTLAYRPPAGFSPTDAAELPDGRLLVLVRKFSLRERFTARLTLVDPRRRGELRGRELARFASPVLHDNLEALAITREGADTIVWIASDDNGNWWQQSLLMKFRLAL